MTSSERINMDVAKWAITQGWTIVPAKVWEDANGKKAVSFHVKWSGGGTADWEQAKDWWVQWPDAVVGIMTKASGLLVIDLDLHSDHADGIENFQELLNLHNGGEMPQTLTMATPTGGMHLYFRNTDPRLKNSASELAPGIDTRGAGDKNGGIVFAGSRFDGTYDILNDAPVADLPQWLADLLAPQEPVQRAGGTNAWDYDPTRRFSPDQAREFCVKYGLQPLMEAQNGQRNNLLNTAAKVMGHFGEEFWSRGFAEGKLRELAETVGLTGDEVEATIRSGLDATDWRAVLVEPLDEESEAKLERDREVAREVRRREVREEVDRIFKAREKRAPLKSRILQVNELDQIPGVEPLIAGFLFKRTVAVLYGRRNVGKTFGALDMALSVATGQPWAPTCTNLLSGEMEGFTVAKGKVLWVAGEGAYGIRSRVAAWKQFHQAEVIDFAVLNGSVELADGDVTDELCGIVSAEQYDLVVIDTLARNSTGLEENSNTDMGTFFERIDRIKNAHDGACVLVVHHAGKSETSTESRGASVIEDAPDSVFKMAGDETHIVFDTTKQRDTVKASRLSFHLQGVPGTESAVIRPGRAPLSDADAPVSSDMQVREIFMTHFENTGCTGAEWKGAIMEELGCSRATAQRYINEALNDWDAITIVDGGKGKSSRYEVA